MEDEEAEEKEKERLPAVIDVTTNLLSTIAAPSIICKNCCYNRRHMWTFLLLQWPPSIDASSCNGRALHRHSSRLLPQPAGRKADHRRALSATQGCYSISVE